MDTPSAIAWFEGLAFPLVSLGVLVVWAYTLTDLWKNPSLSGSAKAMWMLIIVLLPILGPVVYLTVREDW
ncbi:MAG TPA: PLDc N-terminal domain-containing protein [Gaiellaceae bacterium]|nr:PLDc N-terminal domain-containing protein [Gaiellaceae bacterium]HXV58860.1 PLDc N-terminal domain-containing protein [Gaiellaceae bacterium]